MKKLIAILLVLALLTGVLTACRADVPSGEVTPLPESTEAPTEEPTEAPTEESTDAPTEAPAQEPAAETQPEAVSDDIAE